jgi:PAS domain S-box-containing protein
MTRRFQSKITRGFAAISILLALIVTLVVANSHQVRHASLETARTQETLRTLEQVLSTMVDAETGMRGYVLSGQEQFLAPYTEALATIDADMMRLKTLLQQSGVGDAQWTLLQKGVQNQIVFRRGVVEKVKAAGASESYRRSISIDEGKRGMDEVRRIINDLEQSQESALGRMRHHSEEINRRTIAVVIAFVVVAVVLLIGGMMLVRHHLAAREKLEEERNRFFTLSPDMYVVAGTDGYFKEVNPAAERILGFSAAELKGRPFVEFVHPDDRAATVKEAEGVARGERTIYFENRYRTKDGDYRWMLWSAAPALNEQLVYAVARDITEHKKTEDRVAQLGQESRQRAAELEAVNKELEAFSYSVSHDLRAPLRHIAGFSDMLQNHADGSLDEKGKRYLKTIIESAKRMGLLIDDLLVFSRMGRSEMRSERVDLNQLVEATIAELAPDIGGRRIQWTKQSLPEVVGDRAMLKQVFLNLISNAIKYSATRDVANIEIGLRDEAEAFVIFVRDNGVGFDMAYAHKLFGVFQRLHDASQFEGTGIGLANVRRIVGRHGGRVWAEAELDKGATFYFSMPKAKINAAA